MKRDVFPIMKPFKFVAHVLEQESILLWVNLKSTLQKSENEFDSTNWNHSALVNIDNVPCDLKSKHQLVKFEGL